MEYKKETVRNAIMFTIIIALAGCTSTTEKEEKVAAVAVPKAQPPVQDPMHFDGTFVAPGTDFSRYKRVIVTDLGLNDTQITLTTTQVSGNKSTQSLSEQDKRFFREEYTHSVVVNLIADGTYTTALNPADDVLLIKSKIVQISPTVTDDKNTNPGMKIYNEGNATMMISMELYDSMSNKLIGTVTSSRALGLMQNDNNRTSTNAQIRQAFAFWLRTLRTELDALSRRQSPLDKLLRQ